MYSLYIDVLFFINFIVDFLLLIITALLGGYRISRLRFTLSSVIGGIYGILAIFPTLTLLSAVPTRLLFGFVLCLLSFGYENIKKSIKQFLILIVAAISCAGAVCIACLIATSTLPNTNFFNALFQLAPNIVILSAVLVYILLGVILKGRALDRKIINLKIKLGMREVNLRTLVDTGNYLRDFTTNTSVLVVWKENVCALFDAHIGKFLSECDLTDPMNVLISLPDDSEKPPFRLISYHTVGTSNGLLLAFSANSFESKCDKQKTITVALSQYPVSDNATFDAIIGV